MGEAEEKRDTPSIGELVRRRRRQLDMTQADLAMKMGVTRGLVAQWESNRSRIMLHDLPRLGEALQVSTAYLLGQDITALEPDEALAAAKWLLVSTIDKMTLAQRAQLVIVAMEIISKP